MRFTDPTKTRTNTDLDFVDLFLRLIKSDGIKYSEFLKEPEKYRESLQSKAGVYHFFSMAENKVTSLYVGKAGYGNSGKWNLYKRLMQHRQASQQDTIHGAIAKEFAVSNDIAIKLLSDGKIFIQFVEISNKYNTQENVEDRVKGLEDYCKHRLNPKYTDK
jgi:hypothetical protein